MLVLLLLGVDPVEVEIGLDKMGKVVILSGVLILLFILAVVGGGDGGGSDGSGSISCSCSSITM